MARPPSPTGPKTAAQRKAEQRQRDKLAAWSDAPLTEATATALLAALGVCVQEPSRYPERASKLLAELARRAGLKVTVRPLA